MKILFFLYFIEIFYLPTHTQEIICRKAELYFRYKLTKSKKEKST